MIEYVIIEEGTGKKGKNRMLKVHINQVITLKIHPFNGEYRIVAMDGVFLNVKKV